MTKVIFSIILLFQSTAFGINYFWCKEQVNCVRAYGGCGRHLSVHRRYKELYEAKARKSDTVAYCLPPSNKDKVRSSEGIVKCLKGDCRLLMPPKPKVE